MTSRERLRPALALFLIVLGAMYGLAQDGTDNALFLVARPELPDPVFQESVVLMLPDKEKDTGLLAGLIVNKPTRLPLSQVFPDERAFRDRSDTVYFGGPVDLKTAGAVFSASKPPEQAVHLFADLYVSFDPDFIVGMLKKPEPDRNMRLFLGRAQWAPEQLRIEMLRRAWYSERAKSDAETGWIFSKDPQSVWQTVLDVARPKIIARLGNDPPWFTGQSSFPSGAGLGML